MIESFVIDTIKMYKYTGRNEKSKVIYLAAISQEKQKVAICVSKEV